MDIDLVKASKMLSELDLHGIIMDNVQIDVLWFRTMSNSGNWRITRHTHSSFEFHFIYSGSCKVQLDEDAFTVSAGEFYLTAPGVYHEQIGAGSEPLIEFSLNCDLTLLNEVSSEAGSIYYTLKHSPCKPYRDTSGAIPHFAHALREAADRPLGFFTVIKSLVIQILSCAARAMETHSPSPYSIPLKSSKEDYRCDLIEKYINDNLANPISTKDIARHLYLSEKQVCRIVLDKKGVSTKSLISSIKFQKAKSLLKETDLSIKQVSDLLGFSSEYYFHQFFKREEGYPPGIFRYNVRTK